MNRYENLIEKLMDRFTRFYGKKSSHDFFKFLENFPTFLDNFWSKKDKTQNVSRSICREVVESAISFFRSSSKRDSRNGFFHLASSQSNGFRI